MSNIFRSRDTQQTSAQSGFTLVELITVLAIIAILATVAIPAYRKYLIQNAQNQTQAKMKQLQVELESWRASSLTYRGFVPKRLSSTGRTEFEYDNGTTTQINVPNRPDPNYIIHLIAGKEGTNPMSLAPSNNNFNTNYNAWRMLAVPAPLMRDDGAQNIILTSSGKACMGRNITPYQESEAEICPDNTTGVTKW